MNLHRADNKPEWEDIPASQMNKWQQLASKTGGIVTLPNIISLVGFGIVIAGIYYLLQENYWAALILLSIGRAADILDGMLAEATGTKSPLGETTDAVIDKLGTFLTFIALIYAAVAPWWILVLLIAPQVLNSFIILWFRAKNKRWHPSQAGKISMALLWVGTVGLLVLAAMAPPHQLLEIIVYLSVTASIILGFKVSWDYYKQALK